LSGAKAAGRAGTMGVAARNPIYTSSMNMQAAVALAKQHIAERFAASSPRDIRLVGFLYDDHLMVWSLTFGYARAGGDPATKLVRVAEANQAVLSVGDP
jgi:hypothetical protein